MGRQNMMCLVVLFCLLSSMADFSFGVETFVNCPGNGTHDWPIGSTCAQLDPSSPSCTKASECCCYKGQFPFWAINSFDDPACVGAQAGDVACSAFKVCGVCSGSQTTTSTTTTVDTTCCGSEKPAFKLIFFVVNIAL